MQHGTTTYFDNIERCVDDVLAELGKDIRVGMPLGLGKSVPFINALYRRAKADDTITLSVFTALSLAKPTAKSDMEKRFLNPFLERVFGDAPELDYVADVAKDTVPDNIKICEFFMRPGSGLRSKHAQENYVSSNYTHVARDLVDQNVNLVVQMVARRERAGEVSYSLSCNPDVTLDIVPQLQERESRGGPKFITVGVVNNNLPYMVNDAEIEDGYFEAIVDNDAYDHQLFGTPRMSVSDADYAIGLNASALIKDGGTIQVGIGSLGDAIVYATNMRHQDNEQYGELLQTAGVAERSKALISEIGGTNVFDKGLYGSTEMFVDGFMHLYRSGVLKRRVYDNKALQRGLNTGELTEDVTPATIDYLIREGVLDHELNRREVETLLQFGILKDGITFDRDKRKLILPGGDKVSVDFSKPKNLEALKAKCLGDRLKGGVVIHGGFFLGPNDFYEFLRDLSDEERAQVCMTSVGQVNQLYGGKAELKALQRQEARFINTCLMVTLGGSVVSDGLKDNKVLSGVGGQYNFVSMAHAVPGGRSIIMVRAVRNGPNGPESNIVWDYPHCTIPRHLRDIVISEYGIADLRGKTDAEVAAAMIEIADSRFQRDLIDTAKRGGKLPLSYELPENARQNLPDRLAGVLTSYKERGMFPAFPFGNEFTDEELVIGKALKAMKARVDSYTWLSNMRAFLRSRKLGAMPAAATPYLERMGFVDEPDDTATKVARKLFVLELIDAGVIAA